MERQTRRVVTGEEPGGKSVFTHVEAVEPFRLDGGMLRHVVWDWDDTPKLPFYQSGTYSPKQGLPIGRPGGVQIEKWVLPPHFPLKGGHENSTSMHSYDTIDVVFVLEGEIDLEQSDGTVVRLRTGDVLVQNGSVHAWRNPTDRECVLGFVFFGAARTGVAT